MVRRYDAGNFLSTEKTAEGYIKGTARVTRTGIFIYRNADGTTQRQLRHPDEVFSKDSLDSLKMIPITNLHPTTKLVDATDAKALSIGMTGENIIPDGKYISVPITITTQDGVEAILNGRKELSLGYTCEVDFTPGVYDGEPYDSVQRDIRYNHLAIVDRGRAGADVRINMDADDGIDDTINHQTRRANMAKIKLDTGIEYDVPAEVEAGLKALNSKLDEASKDLQNAKAEVEKLKAVADSATETSKQLQTQLDALPGKIAEEVKTRSAIVKIAQDSLSAEACAKLDEMSNDDIKKAVVIARFPEAKLDGVSADYLQARFDAVVENPIPASSAGAQRQAGVPKMDGCAGDASSEARRKKMIEDMVNDSRK